MDAIASSRQSIATSASSSERAIMVLACWWEILQCNAMQCNTMQSRQAIKTTGYDTKMWPMADVPMCVADVAGYY